MSLVHGSYCPVVSQVCVERPKTIGGGGKHHCKRYAPATCFTPERRRPLRFCMDRYEWPNRAGELPRSLVSWPDARALCAGIGKRLCTTDEFNFAFGRCVNNMQAASGFLCHRQSARCRRGRGKRWPCSVVVFVALIAAVLGAELDELLVLGVHRNGLSFEAGEVVVRGFNRVSQ